MKATKKIAVTLKPLVKPTHAALEAYGAGEGHLKALGEKVAAQFPTRDGFAAIKSDFLAACILTSPRYAEQAKIIAAKLPAKDTSEGKAMREAKARARSTVGMAWNLIAKYAFPKAEPTGETRGRKKKADHVKIREHLEAALKLARDSSSGMFDAVKLTGAVKIVLAILPRAIEPSTTEPGRRTPTTPKAPTKRKAPRVNKSTLPGTVGLGKPKQVIGKMLKDRKAKLAAKSNIINAQELTGAITH